MEDKFSFKDIKQLIDLHEFNLIFIPGVVFIVGLLYFYPCLYWSFPIKNLELVILVIFLLMSYAVGYLVEVFGNRLEKLVEYILGDLKDVKKITERISNTNLDTLLETLNKKEIISTTTLEDIDQGEWEQAIRKMKSHIDHEDHLNKARTFNNQSKLCRGLAASSLLLLLIKAFILNTIVDQNTGIVILFLVLSTWGFLWYMRNWEKRELQKIYESYPLIKDIK